MPNRSMIDSITRDYPVLVYKYDRTLGLANQAALEFFGLESESGLIRQPRLGELLNKVPEKSFERKV